MVRICILYVYCYSIYIYILLFYIHILVAIVMVSIDGHWLRGIPHEFHLGSPGLGTWEHPSGVSIKDLTWRDVAFCNPWSSQGNHGLFSSSQHQKASKNHDLINENASKLIQTHSKHVLYVFQRVPGTVQRSLSPLSRHYLWCQSLASHLPKGLNIRFADQIHLALTKFGDMGIELSIRGYTMGID